MVYYNLIFLKVVLPSNVIFFSRLFPEDEAIDMMPILKKSKEMAKNLREKGITFRRSSKPSFTPRNNGGGPHDRGRGPPMRGRRKIFIKGGSSGRGRLNSLNGPPMGIGRKPMLNRMIPKGHPLPRFGGSTTAAAEAYVADYMRTMQYQLPPMPMNPPTGFGSLPPALPRYYDGVPTIPDYPPPPINRVPTGSSNYDKRSYDEFMWKNKNRNPGLNSNRSRDSRNDSYRSDKRYRR